MHGRSPHILAQKRSMPIAMLAEQMLCRRMEIIPKGEQVTKATITKFTDMLHERLLDITIASLHALFKLDCDLATTIEDALVQHGGEGGPDMSVASMEEA
ncbi:hypothetical protein ZWY2020_014937 [Hordeum vulgare]|nr:hypothetical protein ZWY2020_014937 [Hordeum vulgare]